MGQVIILLVNQVIEMKGLNCHFLCPMECLVNDVLIDRVVKFLASIPSKTMHVIQIKNPSSATHPLVLTLKLDGVTSYFDVRKSTQEVY